MISYPWEWPFSLLKDAALLHLDMMEILVPKGFWLRDASAFNVQFNGTSALLVDTLSIGKRTPGRPWPAYRQFCSHFLAPLAVGAYGDIRLLSLWRNYVDGFPLDLAARLLPFRRRLQPGLLTHLIVHARIQQSAGRKDLKRRVPKVTDYGLIGLVRSLRRTIKRIVWRRTSQLWEHYDRIRTYTPEELSEKKAYVLDTVERLKPQMVWDLGGNIGEFSSIIAERGAFVVSIDGDPACTEYLYQQVYRGTIDGRILPLTMDLANPSPGLGWDGHERFSLAERGPADLIVALALIHHLVFSSGVPLQSIAQWLSGLGHHAVVEFIPPEDPMVKKLLGTRGDEHLPYSLELFRSSFGEVFQTVSQHILGNGRHLYFFKRR